MSDAPLDGPPARDYARIALVVCCVLATALAAVLLGTMAGGGIADSPASSLMPGSKMSAEADGEASVEAGELGGEPTVGSDADVPGDSEEESRQFGALDPGDSTSVGGAVDIADNPYQSQGTDVHLTVESPEPAYWRTGSYDQYTGSGWRQTGDTRPYAGGIAGDGIRGSRVEYRVTLNRTANAVPTVWRPARVEGLDGLRVTDGRAVRSSRPLAAGTTYVGTSHRPPRDPAVLRSTDRAYPEAIATRYGTAGPQVTARIERLTDDITADADNPYDEARAIEAWLESNKEYSLNVSRTGENVAETFLFEMERGYCEYFATSMVVMLRSQGIPARYVVGYSTGQQVGPDTYRVRSMNAHAWVEVYFEDVGWVTFDPTPGSDRLGRERQSLQEASSGEGYSPRETGSPGEVFTPEPESLPGNGSAPGTEPPPGGTENDTGIPKGTDTTAPNGTADSDRQWETEDGYEVSLNRSAVPGAAVTVTVTRDGDPAAGRTVLFDGEPIGQTDGNGTVTGRVPYTRRLSVTIEEGTVASLVAPGAIPAGDGRFYRAADPGVRADVTVPVETNATVAVAGDRVAGATVTVTATVEDVPVRDAAVIVEGERVATTDSEGRAAVDLPESPGNVSVAVERAPISGETRVVLPDLEVSVRPAAPLAVPLTDATVTVRSAGEPVADAPVRLDGQRVARTGFDGTATVSLPVASRTTVAVTARGLTREETVAGLFLNLGLLLAGIGLPIAGVFAVAYRRGYAPRDILAFLVRLPGVSVRYAQWILVALGRLGDRLIERSAVRLRTTWSYLLDVLGRRRTLGELGALLLAWLRGKGRALGATGTAGRREGEPTTDGNRNGQPERASAYRDVRAAWDRLCARVSLGRTETKTPGEIARHAVRRDGLPPGPVRELRDAFREVEYGSRPADERVERVERALAAIERAADDGRGAD